MGANSVHYDTEIAGFFKNDFIGLPKLGKPRILFPIEEKTKAARMGWGYEHHTVSQRRGIPGGGRLCVCNS